MPAQRPAPLIQAIGRILGEEVPKMVREVVDGADPLAVTLSHLRTSLAALASLNDQLDDQLVHLDRNALTPAVAAYIILSEGCRRNPEMDRRRRCDAITTYLAHHLLDAVELGTDLARAINITPGFEHQGSRSDAQTTMAQIKGYLDILRESTAAARPTYGDIALIEQRLATIIVEIQRNLQYLADAEATIGQAIVDLSNGNGHLRINPQTGESTHLKAIADDILAGRIYSPEQRMAAYRSICGELA